MPDLLIEIQNEDGKLAVLSHARDARGYRTQPQWGEIWSLAGITSPIDEARLRAYVVEALTHAGGRAFVARAGRANCRRAFVSVDPDARGDPPRRGELLASFALP